MPIVKILFLPWISAILPKGTRNMAEAKIYAVATQLNEIASIENSLPIEGSAILTEDPSKGVRNAARVTTNKVILLLNRSSIPRPLGNRSWSVKQKLTSGLCQGNSVDNNTLHKLSYEEYNTLEFRTQARELGKEILAGILNGGQFGD